VLDIEAAGFEVLDGLLHMFLEASHAVAFSEQATPRHWATFRLLPVEIKQLIQEDDQVSLYQTIRQVLDFISGLTDSNAISLYRKIKGISLV
jgi:dGTPase